MAKKDVLLVSLLPRRKRTRVLLAVVCLSCALVLKDEVYAPLLYNTIRRHESTYYTSAPGATRVYIPPSLGEDRQRTLSLNLGGGRCRWQPPERDVPTTIDFHKTLVVGYPCGDKRLAYVQMEALSGWPAKDEWDFQGYGTSNHPFIKANYPHHEGIWGWGDVADQVVMMVPNIRRAMVEYHDILWDLGYATTWEETVALRDNLFNVEPNLDDYFEWRDLRVMEEARWYGWYIDYWMEGGLRRDVFTHQLTTEEHWTALTITPFYTRAELDYHNWVSDESNVEPSYDPHCTDPDITDGCQPIVIISADKLLDYTEGPFETQTIASVLMQDSRTGQYVIDSEAWDCIWSELIQNGKGPKGPTDRPGYAEIAGDYKFSSEMLEAMIEELDRLIAKYGSAEWSAKPTAFRLVEILEEHRDSVAIELAEVKSGARHLMARDFLGPVERHRRRIATRLEENGRARIDAPGEEGTPAEDSLERKTPERERRETRRRARQDQQDVNAARRQARKVKLEGLERQKYFSALEQKRLDNKRRGLMGADGGNGGGSMSDEDFVRALSDALAKVHRLEDAGKISRETAMCLFQRVKEVADEAKVALKNER